MSVLVVGSVAFDSIETPVGKRERVLGGSATYFSTSASFFTGVSLVAVVGQDFDTQHTDFLSSRGIDLKGLQRAAGKTFHWAGDYLKDLNSAQTHTTELNVFEHFSPELSAEQRAADYLFLGNIDPDLQRRVLEQMDNVKFVAADTMNFWITGKNSALLKTLAKVDLLLVNDAEARQLSGEHNIVKAAQAILTMGPKRLIIKRGEFGAMLFDGSEIFVVPGLPLSRVVDPTGAGDSFAGGFMGLISSTQSTDHATLRRAMVAGSTMASFVVEDFSLDRFRTLTPAQIRSRYSDFGALMRFGDLHGALRS